MVRGRRNPLFESLPARLKRARKLAGRTRHGLSLAAGVSSPVVAASERGSVPRVDVVERIARALHVSPCLLAYGVVTGQDAPPADAPLGSDGIGARLREARERRGLTKKALGQLSGTTGQTIANIERMSSLPGIDVAEGIAKALEVSPCWLAFGEGGPEGPRVPPPVRRRKARGPRLR